MKQYTKGIITGLIIAAVIAAVPTLAANIDALLNPVRININGVDTYQWGEEIALDNGTTTPSSILYNGTTYLPMRKLGELMDKEIYWNGDTQTVSMTGKQADVKVVAEKPDMNGNVWTYYTFKSDDEYFLGIEDKARGFERVYRMVSDSVRVTDNEIYFGRISGYGTRNYLLNMSVAGNHIKSVINLDIMKVKFENTANTQDGESLYTSDVDQYQSELIFDGDWVYYTDSTRDTWKSSDRGVLRAYNYITGGDVTSYTTWEHRRFTDLEIRESTEGMAIIDYYCMHDVGEKYYPLIFNKQTKEFSLGEGEEWVKRQ